MPGPKPRTPERISCATRPDSIARTVLIRVDDGPRATRVYDRHTYDEKNERFRASMRVVDRIVAGAQTTTLLRCGEAVTSGRSGIRERPVHRPDT